MVVYDAKDVFEFCLKVIEKEEINKLDITQHDYVSATKARIEFSFECGLALMAGIEYCFEVLLANYPGFDGLARKWMESDFCTLRIFSCYPFLIYSSLLRQIQKYCVDRGLPVFAPFKKLNAMYCSRGISKNFDAVEDVLKETPPYSEMLYSDKLISEFSNMPELLNSLLSADFNFDLFVLNNASYDFHSEEKNQQILKVFIHNLLPGCCLFWIDFDPPSGLAAVRDILSEFPGKMLCSPIFRKEFLIFSSSNISPKFGTIKPISQRRMSFFIWQKSETSPKPVENQNWNCATEADSQFQRLPGSNATSADVEMERESAKGTFDKSQSEKGSSSNSDLSTIQSLQSYMSELSKQVEKISEQVENLPKQVNNLPKQVESLILVTEQNEATLNEVKDVCQVDENRKSNHTRETESHLQKLQDTTVDDAKFEKGTFSNDDSSTIKSSQFHVLNLFEQLKTLTELVKSLIVKTEHNEVILKELKEVHNNSKESVSFIDFLAYQIKELTANVDLIRNQIRVDSSRKDSPNLHMTKESELQTSIYGGGKALWFLILLFIAVVFLFFLW